MYLKDEIDDALTFIILYPKMYQEATKRAREISDRLVSYESATDKDMSDLIKEATRQLSIANDEFTILEQTFQSKKVILQYAALLNGE